MTLDNPDAWNLDMDGGFGDLDLNFGDQEQPFNLDHTLNEDSMAVELGRDAAPARSARESLDLRLKKGVEDSFGLSGDTEGFGGDFEGMDLDIGNVGDLDINFGDIQADITGDAPGSRQCTCSQSIAILALTSSQLLP